MRYNLCFFVTFLHFGLTNGVIKNTLVALRSKGIIKNPLKVVKFRRELIDLKRYWHMSLQFLMHLLTEIPGDPSLKNRSIEKLVFLA